jgi:hypothetical protein
MNKPFCSIKTKENPPIFLLIIMGSALKKIFSRNSSCPRQESLWIIDKTLKLCQEKNATVNEGRAGILERLQGLVIRHIISIGWHLLLGPPIFPLAKTHRKARQKNFYSPLRLLLVKFPILLIGSYPK